MNPKPNAISGLRVHSLSAFVLVWLSACLLTFVKVTAQTAPHDMSEIQRIENFIKVELPKSSVPGISIAIIKDNETIFSQGYGVADSSGTKVSADTPFQIASLSKSFTALCILQLVDEGLLELDRPVVSALPDFRTRDKARSDKITFRHLLTHRSGLSTLDGNRYQGTKYRGADALNYAMARLSTAKLEHAPGAAFVYSNANYAVLGHILERVDQAPFEVIVKRRVLDPLNMMNSYVQMPHEGAVKEANGYRNWFGFTVEQPFTAGRMMGPAGGVVSSANDMGKYIAAMSNPETDLISVDIRSEMFSGQLAWGDTKYGMGWGITQDERGDFISHEGLNPGFKSVGGFYGKEKVGMVILTNRSSSLSDNFALSVLDVAQNRLPRDYKPSFDSIAMLLGVLVAALTLCVGAVSSLQTWFRRRSDADEHQGRARRLLIKSVWLFAIAYGLFAFLPTLNNMTLPSIYTFYPDLAVCLAIGGSAATLWACSIILQGTIKR